MFDSPTTESTITILNQGFRQYRTPRDILAHHDTQFVSAWDRDLSSHAFKDFLDKNEINHIIARVKHPQTNGKIERWFGLLEQKLYLFNSVDEFVFWYNTLKSHMSLNLDEARLLIRLSGDGYCLNAFSIMQWSGSMQQLSEMNSGYHNPLIYLFITLVIIYLLSIIIFEAS